MEMCRRDKVHWINTWCWTYDPKDRTPGAPAYRPFDLFGRQVEMVHFVDARIAAAEDGLIEKSRDVGFTWVMGAYALHGWLFVPGFKTTFGSRLVTLVDQLGDPDSIFEKIRIMLRHLPPWMRPAGFTADHDNHLRLINPANGNTIRGEGGDEMGRGGRSSMYVIDEGAHIPRADRVEAATSANSEVRIWGSSANGPGNLFYRKRSGLLRPDQVFRFHWSDDPRKTEEWALKKKSSMEDHIWAAEYEIDYSASVEGICIPARWVESAKKIGRLMPILAKRNGVAGLDVGGGGKGKSVFVARFGSVVKAPVCWGNPDTTETAIRGLDEAEAAGFQLPDGHDAKVARLLFDSVGVGAGVLSTLSHHSRRGLVTDGINVGMPPSDTQWPDGMTSAEKFANLKAEAWFLAREKFKATHEMVLFLEGDEKGIEHPPEDLISLPGDGEGPDATALASQLSLPKWFRNERGKVIMESKAELAKRGIPSPDHAEALILTFCETGDTVDIWSALGKG
jgi:phage terminase large subunit